MGLNMNRELRMARALTRSKRKLSVTPPGCRDRRLVHRPYGADSLEGERRSNHMIKRRDFIRIGMLSGVAAATGCNRHPQSSVSSAPNQIPAAGSFELNEKTIAELQEGMKSGGLTARSITEKYLSRIEAIDKQGPRLNSVIELNPDALTIADGLDDERKSKGSRGPLHGIPVLIKDNIDTGDRMSTTAGSLALEGSIAQQDAFIVKKLRDAGAVILGKTN